MFISLILLLLLSNSVTLRRDKSILYSRATITILIIKALTTYNVYFLFLNKGIKIYGGLFHITCRMLFCLSFTSFGLTILIICIEYLIVKAIYLISPYLRGEEPRVHRFAYIPLKSTSLGSGESPEEELRKLLQIKNNRKNEYMEAYRAIKDLNAAIKLDSMLEDKSKNNTMKEIMSFYEHFFDEESGNTKKEGLKQLHKELEGDAAYKESKYLKAKEDYNKLKSQLSESVSAFMFPLKFRLNITVLFHYILPLVNIILPIITLLISSIGLLISILYIFPDIDLTKYISYLSLDLDDIYLVIPDWIFDITNNIQSIIKYEIFITLPGFIWSSFSLAKKIIKYINLIKISLNRIKGMINYIYHVYKRDPYTIFLFLLWILRFIILLFMFIPEELLNIANILALILFNIYR